MQSHTVLFYPAGDVNHPFIQCIHAVYVTEVNRVLVENQLNLTHLSQAEDLNLETTSWLPDLTVLQGWVWLQVLHFSSRVSTYIEPCWNTTDLCVVINYTENQRIPDNSYQTWLLIKEINCILTFNVRFLRSMVIIYLLPMKLSHLELQKLCP